MATASINLTGICQAYQAWKPQQEETIFLNSSDNANLLPLLNDLAIIMTQKEAIDLALQEGQRYNDDLSENAAAYYDSIDDSNISLSEKAQTVLKMLGGAQLEEISAIFGANETKIGEYFILPENGVGEQKYLVFRQGVNEKFIKKNAPKDAKAELIKLFKKAQEEKKKVGLIDESQAQALYGDDWNNVSRYFSRVFPEGGINYLKPSASLSEEEISALTTISIPSKSRLQAFFALAQAARESNKVAQETFTGDVKNLYALMDRMVKLDGEIAEMGFSLSPGCENCTADRSTAELYASLEKRVKGIQQKEPGLSRRKAYQKGLDVVAEEISADRDIVPKWPALGIDGHANKMPQRKEVVITALRMVCTSELEHIESTPPQVTLQEITRRFGDTNGREYWRALRSKKVVVNGEIIQTYKKESEKESIKALMDLMDREGLSLAQKEAKKLYAFLNEKAKRVSWEQLGGGRGKPPPIAKTNALFSWWLGLGAGKRLTGKETYALFPDAPRGLHSELGAGIQGKQLGLSAGASATIADGVDGPVYNYNSLHVLGTASGINFSGAAGARYERSAYPEKTPDVWTGLLGATYSTSQWRFSSYIEAGVASNEFSDETGFMVSDAEKKTFVQGWGGISKQLWGGVEKGLAGSATLGYNNFSGLLASALLTGASKWVQGKLIYELIGVENRVTGEIGVKYNVSDNFNVGIFASPFFAIDETQAYGALLVARLFGKNPTLPQDQNLRRYLPW